MKSPAKIVLAPTIFFALAAIASAQTYCEIPVSPFKHSALIVTRHDAAAGRMRTTLEYPRDAENDERGFYLFATFLHHDLKSGATPTVDVVFSILTSGPGERRINDLNVLVNGRPWSYRGSIRYFSQDAERGMTLEGAVVNLSFESLLTITSSENVVTRLGKREIKLSDDNLEALREIVSLVEPYAKRSARQRS